MELLYKTTRNKKGDMFAVYRCACGEEFEARMANVNNKNTTQCKKCKSKNIALKNIENGRKKFFEKAIDVHGDTYDYSCVDYINAKTKVTIICSIHGKFKQTPSMHGIGQGCPKCKSNKLKGNFSDSSWIDAGSKSERFESYKVYIIKCSGNNENFIKIGKTFMTIKNRFRFTKIPYDYTVEFIYEDDGKAISKIERKLHKELKNLKYIPKLSFNGREECYSLDAFDTIEKITNSLKRK